MKKVLNFILLLLSLGVVACQSEPAIIETATAQKVITTDQGALSIGVLIPDRGMADPHVWIEDGRLYAMCGHDESWDDKNTWVMDRWELWSSADLITWQHHLNIEPSETYIGDYPNCWAGDICRRGDKYYWLFSNRNINIGVMVADKITGPYRDLLGRPLLEEGIIEKPVYDPEIFIEDDVYTICFGVERYYMATLSEDMRSIIDHPKAVYVMKDGVEQGVDDKSTLFKRGDWYYLAYGNRYAMSKNLYGPYEYSGEFTPGGHNSVFKWGDQWYVIQENNDTNIFYRGVGLQPIFFNSDGTIRLASKMSIHPGHGREYRFSSSQMGWRAESGCTLNWSDEGYIYGEATHEHGAIGSAIFLMNNLDECTTIELDLINRTPSQRMRISIASYNPEPMYWQVYPVNTDWTQHSYVDVNIINDQATYQHISVELSEFDNLKPDLMQIRIEPASDAVSGSWQIDNIILN